MTNHTVLRAGLQGVVAAETRLTMVDGEAGELLIAGYPLDDIAPQATYEETLYLLWHDRLPNATELTAFRNTLVQHRHLPEIAYTLLAQATEKRLPVMDALRTVLGTLSLTVDTEDAYKASQAVVAASPTIVAAYWRMLAGDDPIAPDDTLSHAANYLYMLTGTIPTDAHTRALDTYLNTVIDHGLNASTFTARVIISTQSDMISAIVGAVGALKGPLHGGAPGPALDMVFEIGTPDNAEAYLRRKLETGERLMGFGHRVYKVRDPRADVLNQATEQFFASGEDADLYTLAKHVEETAVRLLEEYKPGRRLQTNVEYYTALVLHGIGLESALFSPTFAIARVGGWTAHAREHIETGRLLRPLSQYIGVADRAYTPLTERA
ncbi:MAG: citrate synthase/methylcitrate synthase [Chloroflexota bacterium]